MILKPKHFRLDTATGFLVYEGPDLSDVQEGIILSPKIQSNIRFNTDIKTLGDLNFGAVYVEAQTIRASTIIADSQVRAIGIYARKILGGYWQVEGDIICETAFIGYVKAQNISVKYTMTGTTAEAIEQIVCPDIHLIGLIAADWIKSENLVAANIRARILVCECVAAISDIRATSISASVIFNGLFANDKNFYSNDVKGRVEYGTLQPLPKPASKSKAKRRLKPKPKDEPAATEPAQTTGA